MSYFGKYKTYTSAGIEQVFKRVKEGIVQCPDERKRALLIMGLTTGMRVDEIVLQQWEYGWNDRSFDVIMLPKQCVKGKERSRPVCFSTALKSALDRIEGKKSGFIFQGKMKWGKKSRKVSSITTRTAERWVYDVLKPVGLHDFEAHDLRRLFATIYTLRSEGMGSDLLGVQTILGHQRLGTTAIYIIDQLHNTNRIVNGFFRGTSKYLTGIKPTEPQRRRKKTAKKIKANPKPQEKAKKA